MRSLAHTVPSRLVIPFGVWFSFNFGNTLFNLLFRFGSDSHSLCHSSCSKSLIVKGGRRVMLKRWSLMEGEWLCYRSH